MKIFAGKHFNLNYSDFFTHISQDKHNTSHKLQRNVACSLPCYCKYQDFQNSLGGRKSRLSDVLHCLMVWLFGTSISEQVIKFSLWVNTKYINIHLGKRKRNLLEQRAANFCFPQICSQVLVILLKMPNSNIENKNYLLRRTISIL